MSATGAAEIVPAVLTQLPSADAMRPIVAALLRQFPVIGDSSL
jgi:hypothetical protein